MGGSSASIKSQLSEWLSGNIGAQVKPPNSLWMVGRNDAPSSKSQFKTTTGWGVGSGGATIGPGPSTDGLIPLFSSKNEAERELKNIQDEMSDFRKTSARYEVSNVEWKDFAGVTKNISKLYKGDKKSAPFEKMSRKQLLDFVLANNITYGNKGPMANKPILQNTSKNKKWLLDRILKWEKNQDLDKISGFETRWNKLTFDDYSLPNKPENVKELQLIATDRAEFQSRLTRPDRVRPEFSKFKDLSPRAKKRARRLSGRFEDITENYSSSKTYVVDSELEGWRFTKNGGIVYSEGNIEGLIEVNGLDPALATGDWKGKEFPEFSENWQVVPVTDVSMLEADSRIEGFLLPDGKVLEIENPTNKGNLLTEKSYFREPTRSELDEQVFSNPAYRDRTKAGKSVGPTFKWSNLLYRNDVFGKGARQLPELLISNQHSFIEKTRKNPTKFNSTSTFQFARNYKIDSGTGKKMSVRYVSRKAGEGLVIWKDKKIARKAAKQARKGGYLIRTVEVSGGFVNLAARRQHWPSYHPKYSEENREYLESKGVPMYKTKVKAGYGGASRTVMDETINKSKFPKKMNSYWRKKR